MKKIKRKNLAVLFVGVCFLLTLFIGLFLTFDKEQKTAFAETETETESSLRFTLYNDNSEYKVSAMDRQLTEAIIPAYYNGLPVTEVADNAFMSCANLQHVEIPQSVTRVGNNAFYNCRALQSLVGMINVTEIGNNAFAMCSQLNNLIIPPKVEKLGSSIIRNVTKPVYVRSTKAAIDSLNVNWNLYTSAQIIYGNNLVCSEITDGEGNISGYSINPWQVLMPDYDYLLLCSYKYKECNGVECLNDECVNSHTETYYPITNIDKDAFAGNQFNSLTLKYDDEHIDNHYPINICSQAFLGVIADSINIEVDITLDDASSDSEYYPDSERGASISVFTGSSVKSITLPDSLVKIPRSMFALCSELKYIYNTNPYLGANTLSEKIVSIDTSAFECCTSLELLNIPGAVQYIGNAAFDQWGSTDTRQTLKIDLYKSGDLWDKNWTGAIGENATVVFNTMSVAFEKQGGTGGSDYVDVTYGQPMTQAEAPVKKGYNFDGYYTMPKGQGDKYYDKDMNSVRNWDIVSKVTILYANWTPKKYNVILADGVRVEAVFDSEMPEAPAPGVQKGYKFEGYKGPNGTLYYNEDMTSAHEWDIDENNVQLEPVITQKYYRVRLNDGVVVMVYFGAEMPPAPVPNVDKGRVFKGYSYNGTLYYNADMSSAHVWDVDEDNIYLNLESEEIVTYISYDLDGGVNASGNKSQIKYSETLILQDPTKRGYIFDGWYLSKYELQNDINRVTSLHNIEKSRINLIAKWNTRIDGKIIELDYSQTSLVLPESPYGENYIIVLPKVNFTTNCTITIPKTVQGVHIFSPNGSVYSLSIIINSRGTDFNLLLENLTLMIPVSYDGNSFADYCINMIPVYGSKLNLYTYGSVSILGRPGLDGNPYGNNNGHDGGVAINCNMIEINCSGYLLIKGGDGGSAVNNGKAGLGGVGIKLVTSAPVISGDVLVRGGCSGDNTSCGGGWVVSGIPPVTLPGTGPQN